MRDRDVRLAVRDWLAAVHAGDADTRIVEEMGVWSGTVRIDLAVINGEMTGIELKSDRDTLDRLPLQSKIYSKVFDKVVLVVGAKYTEKVFDRVPEWWGITTAKMHFGKVTLFVERAPSDNPSRDPYLLAQLLWKEEILFILDELGAAKGFRSKSVKFLHEKISSDFSMAELGVHVRAALKRRLKWLGQDIPN